MRNQEGMRLTYGLPGTGWLLIALSQQCGPTAPDALASGAFTYNVARIFSLCSSRQNAYLRASQYHR